MKDPKKPIQDEPVSKPETPTEQERPAKERKDEGREKQKCFS
jgi:hypothetical protein